MNPIYQWILRNKQELSYPNFVLTEDYFASVEEMRHYYFSMEECWEVIGLYAPSKIEDEGIIKIMKRIQKERHPRHGGRN